MVRADGPLVVDGHLEQAERFRAHDRPASPGRPMALPGAGSVAGAWRAKIFVTR